MMMKKIEETNQSMYTIMREMDKNSKLIVSIDYWTLARLFASHITREFGVKFKVRRMVTSHMKKNFILIERDD